MAAVQDLIVPITIAAFAVAMLAVLTPYFIDRKKHVAIQLTCPVCQHDIHTKQGDLTPLPLELVAFVVREDASTYGLPLSEIRCPGCGVYHIYATNSSPPRYLMSNPLSDKHRSSTCSQCRAPLARPAWPRGAYDGKLAAAPGLSSRHGLACKRCGAVTCVACAEDASRNRTRDGAYLCPRCFRGPLDTVHHF